MINIYTYERYHSYFSSSKRPEYCIADDGYIYTYDEYSNSFWGKRPCGKVSFSKNYIYGESGVYGFTASPEYEFFTSGNRTEIYSYPRGFCASPIWIIESKEVYSSSDYYRLIKQPTFYIEFE